jgi:hypothetical protein
MREREAEDGGDQDGGRRGACYSSPAPEPTSAHRRQPPLRDAEAGSGQPGWSDAGQCRRGKADSGQRLLEVSHYGGQRQLQRR